MQEEPEEACSGSIKLGLHQEPGLHDFRRVFYLTQLQAGLSETVIARLMGHTTTALIARYAKQTTGDLGELKIPIGGCAR